jgi:predicted transcriptional regulator
MQDRKLVLAVTLAILETVVEAGDQGAPSGPMYAAVMGQIDLQMYEAITETLVSKGLLTQSGHVFRATKTGVLLMQKANEALGKPPVQAAV